VERFKVAYDTHHWLRRACWAGLIVVAPLLLWISGGFPPLAWRLLARSIPELSYLVMLHGPILLLSLGALIALSLTWLIAWGALLGATIVVVRHALLSRRAQQQYERDLQREQEPMSWQTGAQAWRSSREHPTTFRERRGDEAEAVSRLPPTWLQPLMADALGEGKTGGFADHGVPQSPDQEVVTLQPPERPSIKKDSQTRCNTMISLDFETGWDRGITRKDAPNEDSLIALQGNSIRNEQVQPFGLFAVADGMGGHADGQEASRIAIEALSEVILPVMLNNTQDEEQFSELLAEGVHEANLALYQYNKQQGPAAFMGTTLTAALIIGSTAYIVNVGDSRTYLYRRAEGLCQITRDHSVVARLVEEKVISPHEIYAHPKRNEIYRCLGELASVQADLFTVPLQDDDMLLLCSDGVWEMVRDPDIDRIIGHPLCETTQICKALVEAALQGGGKDNISVIIVRVHR
jgi:serine/threonine protein phosphatase PrpC